MTKNRMRAKKHSIKKKPNVSDGEVSAGQANAAREAARQQTIQRMHAMLKVKFADLSVALDIVIQERNQAHQELLNSQQIIDKLTKELEEAMKPKKKDAED